MSSFVTSPSLPPPPPTLPPTLPPPPPTQLKRSFSDTTLSKSVNSYSAMGNQSQPQSYEHLSEYARLTADQKIQKFDGYFNTFKNKLNEEDYVSISFSQSQPEVEPTAPNTGQKLFLSYFIGRCNPPHEGHISAILALLQDVKEKQKANNKARALILLGSGPRRERTKDNPIDFDLKKRFIESKIIELDPELLPLSNFCVIQEMNNAFGDVPRFVGVQIGDQEIDKIASVTITHFAGDKDGDSTKFTTLGQRSVTKVIDLIGETVPVTAETNALEPTSSAYIEKPMSATQVRNDVYANLPRDVWLTKYGGFYGTFAEEMYKQILEKAGVEGSVKKVRKKGGRKTKRKIKTIKTSRRRHRTKNT